MKQTTSKDKNVSYFMVKIYFSSKKEHKYKTVLRQVLDIYKNL